LIRPTCKAPAAGLWLLPSLALLFSLTLGGCAGIDPARIPAIDAGADTRLPGKVVWHDLLSEDPAAAKRFYGGLFGWTFRDVDLGAGQTYSVIEHDGRAIGGIVDGRGINDANNVSRWIPVLSVADMSAAMSVVRAGGGNRLPGPRGHPDARRHGRGRGPAGRRADAAGIQRRRPRRPAGRRRRLALE
jgi:predicted enzyme related to lactoylglutathione lyase